MTIRRLHIEAQADHVLRLAHRDRPVEAIIELIWNSLDAEARRVDVVIQRNDADGVESVQIIDDGHGVAPEAVPAAFEHLGGSWKAKARVSPTLGRPMNGANGQGRIRGFALGNVISWTTTARDTAGVLQRTIITGRVSDPTNFDPSESPVIGDEQPQTVFLAREPAPHVTRITGDTARPRITAAFALFLTANPDVKIRFDGADLDPASAEKNRADYTLDKFAEHDRPAPLLRIIEWENDPGRAVHLCDTSGAVLDTVSPDLQTPGFKYTAYVLWDEFAHRKSEMQLAELQAGEFGEVIAASREQIKSHFRNREAERRAEQVQEWKNEGDYPYEGEPQEETERAERETYDFVATSVAHKLPGSKKGRRAVLGLLKVAIANEPSSVPDILNELLPLPRREQDDLARLLVRTPMSKIIAANTALINRLDFLAALRRMVFDTDTSKVVKERSELHKILTNELWVFGDEYMLLTSDRGLDEVLERHLAVLRPPETKRGRKTAGTSKVRRADGSRGIVDLMLSQQRRGIEQREHLVVELKRPSVTITQKEVGQLKSYADAVASDDQYLNVKVHWDFWVISSDLDSTVRRDAAQPNRPLGQIAEWGNIRLWAMTWSQVLESCETRLRHFKDSLEYDASQEHAADYINRTHAPETIPATLRAVADEDSQKPPLA